MSGQDPGPPRPSDPAGQLQPGDPYARPALRWPFRVLGAIVALLSLLVLLLKARSLLRGEVALPDMLAAEYGMLLACVAFATCFGAAAATGKVPEPVWMLFRFLQRVD